MKLLLTFISIFVIQALGQTTVPPPPTTNPGQTDPCVGYCKNGGTCSLVGGSPVCQCLPFFQGFDCSEQLCSRLQGGIIKFDNGVPMCRCPLGAEESSIGFQTGCFCTETGLEPVDGWCPANGCLVPECKDELRERRCQRIKSRGRCDRRNFADTCRKTCGFC